MARQTDQDEEKQKDDIIQQINDRLEIEGWGGGCDRLVIKVVIEGKFNLKDLLVHKKPLIRRMY